MYYTTVPCYAVAKDLCTKVSVVVVYSSLTRFYFTLHLLCSYRSMLRVNLQFMDNLLLN
jgi:hypothetical protein